MKMGNKELGSHHSSDSENGFEDGVVSLGESVLEKSASLKSLMMMEIMMSMIRRLKVKEM